MSESGREIRQGLGRNEEENKEVDKKHVQEGKIRGKDKTKDVREVKDTWEERWKKQIRFTNRISAAAHFKTY